jgi:hypothetical protein
MKKWWFLSVLIFCIHILYGQENSVKLKNAVGINMTFLLSQVISVGDNDDGDKFNLLYTRYGKKVNFRIGANLKYTNDSEIVDLSEQSYKLRLGIEKNVDLSSKFTMMYGLDGLGTFYKSVSESIQTNFRNIEVKKSFGAGPCLRFEYRLSNRVSLMTESTLYFLFGNLNQELFQAGNSIQKTNKNFSNFNTTIPSVLYLNIHF